MDAFVANDLLNCAGDLLTCVFTLVAAVVSYLCTWRA
jgi:hypothetical protein